MQSLQHIPMGYWRIAASYWDRHLSLLYCCLQGDKIRESNVYRRTTSAEIFFARYS
jgi:hypothetical protein